MFADITLPALRKHPLPEEYASVVTDRKHRLDGFEERELEWSGTQLRYAVGGPRAPEAPGSFGRASSASPATLPASGPPLVLVHGLGGTIENWRALASPLVARHRVLVPDLPGHGRSAPLSEARSVDTLAEAVLGIVDAEGVRGAVWIGHSFGGTVALR